MIKHDIGTGRVKYQQIHLPLVIKILIFHVLAGWEGSATDGRVLRDAINKNTGLKVVKGTYYLCDNGYANSKGFLTPYKGVRYHLKEWGPDSAKPKNAHELFNLRHTKARNVIERAFGIMKMRWAILRSPSFYPIREQNRLIMACFLLHNFMQGEMLNDPIEEMPIETNEGEYQDDVDEYVDVVEPTNIWNQKREELANYMWQNLV